ncbi:phage GP46 family protein [[Pasteurella] aerogenes]|nr:phage GP46 family protein [[Pasteurella] aerogenes]
MKDWFSAPEIAGITGKTPQGINKRAKKENWLKQQIQGKQGISFEYARDALQWMITDKLVSSLSVTATNPKQSMLLLTIIVTMPNGTVEQRTFSATWSI